MSDQYVALPLDQKAETDKSNPSGKIVTLLSLLAGLCVALWVADDVNQQAAAIDDAASLAAQPMKQVSQPVRNAMRMNFMQPASREVFNGVEGAAGSEPRRRAILAGLAVLPMFAVADQAKAGPANLAASKFGPYFNYAGDLAVTGKVSVKGGKVGETAGQDLSWSLSGVDPKCADGPGGKPNSCGVHIHKGQSCKEDALGHYFATPEDPWKTIVYSAKTSAKNGFQAAASNVKVATELTNADVMGRTFIVHDFEGARVACGILE